MYDVIVIGAGPAGSTAAKTLAERGYRTLLVEKFKMPRYKSCSGQLIQKTVDLVQRYFGEAVPTSAMCAPAENRGMIFTNDRGQSFRFEQAGLNVWRSTFDAWLAEKAVRFGAEVREGVTALSCEEQDGIVSLTMKGTSIGTEQATYVIDCEGVVGALKRKLLRCDAQYIATYQTFNRGSVELDDRYFYAYLHPELSEYDAWMNVKDHQLVLGVSVRSSYNCGVAEQYYGRFLSYMEEKHHLRLEEQCRVDRWLMPCVRPGCPIDYGVGRVLFAGEVAGFLNPMGEGISSGMESGYCAAEAVMQCFDNPGLVLERYRDNTRALHSYMKRQWNFVAGMTDTFKEMRSDLI